MVSSYRSTLPVREHGSHRSARSISYEELVVRRMGDAKRIQHPGLQRPRSRRLRGRLLHLISKLSSRATTLANRLSSGQRVRKHQKSSLDRCCYIPLCETLESRRLLAVAIWDGGGPDANWSTPENWVGDVVPSGDDQLVFPINASQNRTPMIFPSVLTFKASEFPAAMF